LNQPAALRLRNLTASGKVGAARFAPHGVLTRLLRCPRLGRAPQSPQGRDRLEKTTFQVAELIVGLRSFKLGQLVAIGPWPSQLHPPLLAILCRAGRQGPSRSVRSHRSRSLGCGFHRFDPHAYVLSSRPRHLHGAAVARWGWGMSPSADLIAGVITRPDAGQESDSAHTPGPLSARRGFAKPGGTSEGQAATGRNLDAGHGRSTVAEHGPAPTQAFLIGHKPPRAHPALADGADRCSRCTSSIRRGCRRRDGPNAAESPRPGRRAPRSGRALR